MSDGRRGLFEVVVGAGLLLLLTPAAALADTGPPIAGGVPGVDDGGPGAPIGLVAAVLGVLVLGLVANRRPAWRRPIAAALIVVAGALVALAMLMFGVLSDWTDSGSNVPAPFVVAAAVSIGVGLLGAGWVLRVGQARR